MAEIRFNYGDKFTQTSDSNTGIGSTIPAAKLDIAGGTSAGSLRVSGIATLPSYQGFVNTKLSTTEDLIVEAGQSGSVSGEVVIGTGQTISVSTGATTGQGGVHSLKVFETFMPPVGGTADRPTDVKPGMVYYNKDFKTIEFWDGNFWKQVDNVSISGRGVWSGGTTPTYLTLMDFVTISSLGNAQFFGDLVTDGRGFSRAVASNVRGVNGGGEDHTGGRFNQLEYFTIQSGGTAIDFGDLSAQRGMTGSASSSTRGIFAGGEESPGNVNTIEFIEISTIGNAVDFGDISSAKKDSHNGLVNSPTRGVFAGGYTPTQVNTIDFITFSTLGDAADFGDLTHTVRRPGGGSNAVRGIIAGGNNYDGGHIGLNNIDFITLATLGDSTDFGDLTSSDNTDTAAMACSPTRAAIFHSDTSTPNVTNTIDYVQIMTTGNALDFGDMNTNTIWGRGGCSNGHGGLG